MAKATAEITRADALPRASNLPHTLAARVDMKRNCDLSLHPGAFLTLVAETYAVTRALAALPGKAEPEASLAALRGVTRQSHVPPPRPASTAWAPNSGARQAGAWRVSGDMLIRLTQEDARTYRRTPGLRSATRSASPAVPAALEGCHLAGLYTELLETYGVAQRSLDSGEHSRNAIVTHSSRLPRTLGDEGRLPESIG